MIVVFKIAFILFCAYVLANIFKENVLKLIPTTIFILITIMLIGGYLSNLVIAKIFVYVFFAIIVLVSVIKCKIKIDKTNLIYLGVAIGIIAFIYIYNYDRYVFSWDEYSHWARVIKNMYYTSRFSRQNDEYLLYGTYPPNVSLFLYFFQDKNGFIEWKLFVAQSIYTIALCLPIIKYTSGSKSIFHRCISILVAFTIPIVFNDRQYSQLYVDALMGLLLGYAIIEYYFNSNNVLKWINISLSLMLLSLTKDAGIILSIIAILIFLADVLFCKHSGFIDKNSIKKSRIDIFIAICIIFLGFFSWRIYLQSVGIVVDQASSYKQLITSLPPYWKVTCTNFLELFMRQGLKKTIFLTPISILFIGFIVATIVYFICKYSKNKNQNVGIRLAFGIDIVVVLAFIYFILIFVTYIARFSEYESTRCASFERYSWTILTAVVMFSITTLLAFVDNKQGWIAILASVSILLNTMCSYTSLIHYFVEKKDTYYTMKFWTNISNSIQSKMETNSKVTIVSFNDDAYSQLVLGYYLGPRNIVSGYSEPSLTKDSIYSYVTTAKDYMQYLNNEKIKYIYLRNITNEFKNNFELLFEDKQQIKNGNLFKIEKNKFVKIN